MLVFRSWLCGLLLAGFALAQGPLVLNTTLRGFVTVVGKPRGPDIKGWTDNLGRDFAIVCRGNTGLAIYEITNPAAPVLAASIAATGTDLKDVDLIGNYAYCIQQTGEVMIIDISNPYAAFRANGIASAGHTGYYDPAQQLYIQCRNGASPFDARIYDVSAPGTPVFLSSYPAQNPQTHDCFVQDGIMYVSLLFNAQAGTDVVDISNPLAPMFLHKIPTGNITHSCWMYNPPGGRKVLLSANEEAGGHIKIYDVTNPIVTPLLAEWQSPTGAAISVHNPQVEGRYAYISYYADYLRILDLANPAVPVQVGIYDPNATNAGAGVFDGSWATHFFKVLPNGDHRIVMTESFAAVKGFYIIDFTPPPAIDLDVTSSGAGDVALNLTGLNPGGMALNALSLSTTGLMGQGPLFGLAADALFTLTYPFVTEPFSVLANASGDYSFNLPNGSLPPGLTVDLRSAGELGSTWFLSQLARITF